jgi:hypothetical protein
MLRAVAWASGQFEVGIRCSALRGPPHVEALHNLPI